jgi:hypothetical protein
MLTESEINKVKCEASSHAALTTEVVLKYHARRVLIGAGVLSLLAVSGFAYSKMKPGRTPPARERATAKCMDGTYSYAYNRQGACSGHGGVKVFYKGRQ